MISAIDIIVWKGYNMKIDKIKLDKIIEVLMDYMEYDIEGSSFTGFDITPSIHDDDIDKVIDELNKILEE